MCLDDVVGMSSGGLLPHYLLARSPGDEPGIHPAIVEDCTIEPHDCELLAVKCQLACLAVIILESNDIHRALFPYDTLRYLCHLYHLLSV